MIPLTFLIFLWNSHISAWATPQTPPTPHFRPGSSSRIRNRPEYLVHYTKNRGPRTRRGAGHAFRQIASLSGGAYLPFSLDALGRLKDLLGAIAVFAAGGLAALERLGAGKNAAVLQLTSQLKRQEGGKPMFMISMPVDFQVGDTRDCQINGEPAKVTYRDAEHLVIEPDDVSAVLHVTTENNGLKTFFCGHSEEDSKRLHGVRPTIFIAEPGR